MAEPNALMVASNAFFIIPCIKAVTLHTWTRAGLYFLMIFASSFYHAYYSAITRKTDFFFAQLLIPVTALYIVKFTRSVYFLERWLIMAFAVAIFLVEVVSDEPFWMQLVVAGASALIIAIYWLVYAARKGRWVLPPYDWDNFALGIALTATACSLYATQMEWHNGRAYIHSAWHALAALGQYFILCINPPKPRYAALDAPVLREISKGAFAY